jgi:hypothetical protein
MTSGDFLEFACKWAFEHDTTLVSDSDFLPAIRSTGISDDLILNYKRELQQRGAIFNHCIIGGWKDFTINRNIFHKYVRKSIPDSVERARALFASWKNSITGGQFTSSYLAKELGISERDAHYILDLLI